MIAAVLTLAAAVGPARAQACLDVDAVSVLDLRGTIASVRYEGGAGVNGRVVGAELVWSPAGPTVMAQLAFVDLDEGEAEPVVGRLEVSLADLRFGGARLCGSLLGGLSRIEVGPDHAGTLAIGPGLTLSRGAMIGAVEVVPYAQLRALFGATSGEILEQDLDAHATSLGIEWGLRLAMGRAVLRGSIALDGLDSGLGIPPFPSRALRLSAGYGF